MGISTDYVERHLQKLAEAIARILGFQKKEEHDQAVAAIEQTLKDHFGVSLPLLAALDSQSLSQMWSKEQLSSLLKLVELHALSAPNPSSETKRVLERLREIL